MPAVNNIIQPVRGELLYIKDVLDCDQTKVTKKGNEIKFPYIIEIVDSEGNIVSNEATKSQIFTENWDKFFYLKDDDRIRFSQNSVLIAVMKIIEARDPEQYRSFFKDNGSFDVNQLIDYSFEGKVVRSGGYLFIDWVATFKMNHVEIPVIERTIENSISEQYSEVDPDSVPI